MREHLLTIGAASLLAVTIGASPALADIAGFGDFSAFQINQGDASPAPTIFPDQGMIRITSQAANQTRSIFSLTPQTITEFTASYTYRATGTPTVSLGACFVIQNSDPFGPFTVVGPSLSQFGYGNQFGTFNHSIAVSMQYGSLEPGSSSTGVYQDGLVAGGSSSMAPVDLFSGNPIRVTISYDGSLLHQHFEDTVSGSTFDTFSSLNIAAIVGNSTAYVGFTAGTSANTMTEQYLSDFQFTAIPAPGALALLAIAGVGAPRRRRR